MGNESHHHQQFYHRHHHHKSTMFLPILCSRPSIKDVTIPRCRGNSSSSSGCNDPLSPKIGCMGQVKRNNKISGFPISTSQQYNRLITNFSKKSTTATTIPSPVIKYSKLKRLFSSKNLTITTPSTTTNISYSSCNRTKKRVTRSNNQRGVNNNRNMRSVENAINIEAMDPPLPVVKRVPKLEEGECLWKRRSGGPTIKSLQLQQIQHPKICPQPTTV